MRFSYAPLPVHPATAIVDTIVLAEQLGFHGAYFPDETYHKDAWLIAAVAARQTRRIRLSPCATHVILKDPTILAQTIATLDELSDGRAEAVFAIGNIAMLGQYGIDWKSSGGLRRLREAHHVLRTTLDEGKIDFEGEFYRYSGLFTAARPVQEHVPLKIGAIRGPGSFELAGEIADGMHQGCGCSQEAIAYATEHVNAGAERAGRDPSQLDIGSWMFTAIAPDSRAAREAARSVVAFYVNALPREHLARHGIDLDQLQPIMAAVEAGEIERAIELTPVELADKLSLAGSPDECVEHVRNRVVRGGANHLICCPVDPFLVEAWSGRKIEGVPDQAGQLRLIHEHVMPEFVPSDAAVSAS
jgi:5,10-methylenetetrahydromethanopterin reductase